ncbi:MAG: glycerol dehydrogenase [Planctomycetaceae bacterium]|nr:glycerol dehydrogenase [Planctomycetaceae bacterium]
MPLGKAPSSRAFAAPGKYIQGPNELRRLPDYVARFGTKALILVDPFSFSEYSLAFASLFAESSVDAACRQFSGQCCDEEIERVCAEAREAGADVVVGMGGGRTLDTIKSVALALALPMILCPSSIATDAPTSASSIVYYPDHTYRQDLHAKNPECVIVDTEVVLRAPVRLFVAGMGDALATWVEARACQESDNVNNVGSGYRRTLAGMAIARLSYDLLLEKGRDAPLAVKNGIRSEVFEDVAEINTLLSGVGFENTGCSVAHGLQASLSILPDTGSLLHGELVAFGVLCQLAVENRSMDEYRRVFSFNCDVGLPVRLADIGIAEDVEYKIRRCIRYGMEQKAILKIVPFTMTEERLYNAVMFVDAYGKKYRTECLV